MILGGTREYIRVEFHGKVVKIQGELLCDGFIVYKNTIERWEPPYENEALDEDTIEKIIEHVINQSNANFKIEIE